MSQKIQLFLIICIAIATGALVLNSRRPQEPVLQEITIVQPEKRSITVASEGEVKVRPNMVEFVIVIETTEKELADAKLQNENIFLESMSILENHATEKNDINSDYLRIKTEATSGRIYKYIVTKSVKVIYHDLAELDALFTDLQEAGIGRIEEIVFSVSNINTYREQALQIALSTASEKAKAIASGINREIGEPISIQENLDANQELKVYFQNLTVYSREFGYSLNNLQSASFTEITVKTSVTVEFELK